jgi:hypothetical protein
MAQKRSVSNAIDSVHPLTVNQPSPQEPSVEDQSPPSASPHSTSTSPPPGANVRRHVSLTAAAAGGNRKAGSGLKRAGTLQATLSSSHAHYQSHSPPEAAQQGDDNDSVGATEGQYEEYSSQTPNYPTSPIGRQSPWTPGSNSGQNADWRTTSGFASLPNQSSNAALDDVQRALSALEIASSNNTQYYAGYGGPGSGQSAHPPRFNPTHPPPLQPPGAPRHQQNAGNNNFKLANNPEGRKTPLGAGLPRGGLVSAGDSYYQGQRSGQNDDRAQAGVWEGRERALSARSSNTNLHQGYHSKNPSSSSTGSGVGNGSAGNDDIPSVPPIPPQYLQQQSQRMGNNNGSNGQLLLNAQQMTNTPVDVPTLIAMKGYNPPTFDTKPTFARYFVIKSYTEDDVHKSLKYEIWSSTDPGNKRLDKAFKETAGRGPIYLFFSVNAR